ncbi:hypothetical protein CTEN210_05806 [Chaetoceros tenuissimus]|uniref:Peptidase S1 domain-containing protein n=1 Tax=Chaetoceros tenuissimus TaxID=426638 RepID=A0AAD3CQK4_9STRA|nr:hypothetical protein CTEN210_05806 [Chaetoceros tenuissimus]
MQELNQEHTSSRRNKRICYIILAVMTTYIVIMAIIGFFRGRDLEVLPLEDLSQNNSVRLLQSEEVVGPSLVLNVTNEIMNGDDVGLYEYPWFVQLEDSRGYCSASLIAPEYVLTAAHCVDQQIKRGNPKSIDPATLTLKVGFIGKSKAFKEKFSASEIIIYTKWNGDIHKGGDIAIIKINGKSKVTPATVYPKFMLRSGLYNWKKSDLKIIGSGRNEVGQIPDTVQDLDVKVISRWTHYRKYGWPSYSKNVVAVVGEKKNSGACSGDSGGPLFDPRANAIHGVTSYGKATKDGSCSTKHPSYYTMTEKYIDFIIDYVCKSASSKDLTVCLSP